MTTGGHGPAVVLIHGYAEDSRMWKPLAAALAQHFTVIAPDLPGIGNSAIPAGGSNMSNAARHVRDAVRALGYQRVSVVGHDIGLMVAYAYAATYPHEVQRLALMDAFLPGVTGWRAIYDSPNLWHFRFHGSTPLALVSGRERTYFDYYWNDFAPIPTIRSRLATAACTSQPTPGPGAWRPVGPTSIPFRRPPSTSHD
ncbi:MAG TPA: alpha/beta fold hydrolase [Candidatus Cybelea sp.]